MARVKVCSACGHANVPQEMFCTGDCCGASLANVDVTEAGEEEPAAPAAEAAPAAPGAGLAQAPRTTREAPCARLEFDWGDEWIGESLAVGRDPAFSPLAGRLAAYRTVSGRHAELEPQGDAVQILQLGGTNPTYVDGRPLQAGESARARDGARIGFSRAVTAILRIG